MVLVKDVSSSWTGRWSPRLWQSGLLLCFVFLAMLTFVWNSGPFGKPFLCYLLHATVRSSNEVKTTTHLTSSATNKPKMPMNVLLLYADDWRYDSLGIASNGLVQTPFLDKFAEESVRFTHNCVTTSVCWVSRASCFTGQYLSRHKSSLPKYPRFYKNWDNQSFPGILRTQSGYHVGHVGKWQFDSFDEEMRSHFDFARIYSGQHWYPSPVPGGPPLHAIERNQRDALDFLQSRPRDRPFLLTVAFFPPHAVDGTTGQYFPQNKTMELYRDVYLMPPNNPNMSESWKHLPNFFDERNEGRNRWHFRFDNPHKYQRMLKNYYRLVTGVDDACRRIVQELKRQDQYENTLIIFTADNGLYHGEHGLAGKWYPHQESIRIPLMIRDPRMPETIRNTTNDAFTLNIDLAPTILSATNHSAPCTMQGQDMAKIYLSDEDWRDEFYYEHPKIDVRNGEADIPGSTALVRKYFKYIFWSPDRTKAYHHPEMEQLFELGEDPKEENNLAARPDYLKILLEMRGRHNKLRRQVRGEQD